MTLRSIAAAPVGPAIILPIYTTGVAAAAWPAINRAIFMRFCLQHPTPIRYLNWTCAVQSGNVQVGVVALSGANRTTFTPVVATAVIACPAAGSVRSDLGATVLPAGDYAMFQWADNTTFQTRYSTASSNNALRVGGLLSSLASGVITGGTLAWDNPVINPALEADV